jgi:hypothetical protein
MDTDQQVAGKPSNLKLEGRNLNAAVFSRLFRARVFLLS